MAAGTAIVASSLDGYRNVATDGLDALLVEPGDVDGVAAALRRVLVDATVRTHLVAGGYRRAEQFSMVSLAELYVERYQKVLAAAPAGERPSAPRRWLSRMLS